MLFTGFVCHATLFFSCFLFGFFKCLSLVVIDWLVSMGGVHVLVFYSVIHYFYGWFCDCEFKHVRIITSALWVQLGVGSIPGLLWTLFNC